MKIDYPNRNEVSLTEHFKKFETDFNRNIDFLENLSGLINLSERIILFISGKKSHTINASLLDNSVRTLKSIKLCCSIGSFADANTLIRKMRDDLLLYIYVLAIANQRKPFTQKSIDNLSLENSEEFSKTFSELELNIKLTDDERVIDAWLDNKVLELPRQIKMKLSFENYMKILKSNENIDTILTKYNLQGYWEVLRTKLNNYVHNNGNQFTSHNLIHSESPHLETCLTNVNIRSSYVISFFISIITMIDSALLSSGDIQDYLDLGIELPEDYSYEIAPFIQEFIDENVVKLHPELKQYLQDNNINGMTIH